MHIHICMYAAKTTLKYMYSWIFSPIKYEIYLSLDLFKLNFLTSNKQLGVKSCLGLHYLSPFDEMLRDTKKWRQWDKIERGQLSTHITVYTEIAGQWLSHTSQLFTCFAHRIPGRLFLRTGESELCNFSTKAHRTAEERHILTRGLQQGQEHGLSPLAAEKTSLCSLLHTSSTFNSIIYPGLYQQQKVPKLLGYWNFCSLSPHIQELLMLQKDGPH